jgi:glycosyltransferase involved in cell wall biosynthesis
MISFLFLDTERVWRGGQDQLFTLLQGLLGRGHRIDLVCHPGTLLEERARQLGVGVHPVAVRSELGPFAFCRIFGILRRVEPDVLAFNTPRPIWLGNIASLFTGVRTRILFRRVNFPLRRNIFSRLKYRWRIDCIIAISASIQHQLERSGVPLDRIRLVYEGIDPGPAPERDPRARLAAGPPMVVGSVAHLSAEKGHAYLVEAAARIPRVRERIRLVIVGDGDCRSKLQERVSQLGLDEVVHFAGFQSAIPELLRSFDLFVMPSLSEGLSSAILSAMAAGLAVVATDVGGIPELVRPEVNGILVPPADPDALARAIEKLADEPEEAFRMGAAGRRRMEQFFTLERKIVETERICTELIGERRELSHPAHG